MSHHILQFDGQALELFGHARAACAQIPPAFALEATVAVNPFLGQSDLSLAMAAARLARVGGVSVTQPRAALLAQLEAGQISEADLAEAVAAQPGFGDVAALRAALAGPDLAPVALPTLAQLAAQEGQDWPAIIAARVGLWAGGHFDRGQAFWPAPNLASWASWRSYASRDLTCEIHGLRGFCAFVEALPERPELALLALCEALGVTPEAAPTLFHRALLSLPGWAQYARGLCWQAEIAGQKDTHETKALEHLLLIALAYDAALLAAKPALRAPWAQVVLAHSAPLEPSLAQQADVCLQEAAERAAQRDLAARLSAPTPKAPEGRAPLQAVFCIDVRSEVYRRALEAQHPGIQTLGFAGFFGIGLAHSEEGSHVTEARVPALLPAGLATTTAPRPPHHKIAARATRAWGRFRQAAVSSLAFVEAAGLTYGAKLTRDSVFGARAKTWGAAPVLPDLSPEQGAAMAAGALRGMGLVAGFAPTVLILGHDAEVTNAPHASALACGACGGHGGAVNARALAQILNRPKVRAALIGQGIEIPADTIFVPGVHGTTTDAVTLFIEDLASDLAPDLAQTEAWLRAASAQTRAMRAPRLPGARVEADILRRATDWAETRPEWGLAGCAAFIAAPRSVIRGTNLEGRVFLQEYSYEEGGAAGLEAILCAPVVVASWIGLQYYGSVVAPQLFGGGSKLLHNVVGGFGVVEGTDGQLRTGLPLQSVHNGSEFVHQALRLSVCLSAPPAVISAILARQPGVAALFDNGWLHLFALDAAGQICARYRPGGKWEQMGQQSAVDKAAA